MQSDFQASTTSGRTLKFVYVSQWGQCINNFKKSDSPLKYSIFVNISFVIIKTKKIKTKKNFIEPASVDFTQIYGMLDEVR